MSRMFRKAGLVAVLSLAGGLGVLAGSASAQSTSTNVPFNQGSLYYSPSYDRPQPAAGYYQPYSDIYAPGTYGYPYSSFAPGSPSPQPRHRPWFPARRGLGLAKPWLWHD